MGKSNVAEKTAPIAEVVEVVEVAPVLTIVKDEVEAPRKLTLDERIQRVEDLSMLIDRRRWSGTLELTSVRCTQGFYRHILSETVIPVPPCVFRFTAPEKARNF